MKHTIIFLFGLLGFSLMATSQITFDDYIIANSHINKAREEISNKDYNNAIKNLRIAIKADSTNRDAYLLSFTACFQANDFNSGVELLSKGKSTYYDDDEIIYYLGKIYQSHKEYDNAIAEYSQAITFSKENGEDYPIVYDYYSSRGICYFNKERYIEALADFDYSIKLNSTKGSIFINRGFTLYNLNKKIEACKSWEIAIQLGENGAKKYIEKYCKKK